MPRTRSIKILRNLSYLYLSLTIPCALITQLVKFPRADEVIDLVPGCYISNAPLIPPIECHGFFAHDLVAFFLSYSKFMVEIPVFILLYPGVVFYHYALSFYVLVMWSPVFYLLWYWFQGRRAKRFR